MENTENLNPTEEDSDQDSNSPETEEKKAPNQLGSSEFYQGEKQLEEVDIPALKKGVKVEIVKKEEIYKDKAEKHEAFIASLGRKKTEEKNTEKHPPEYVEGKGSSGKKIFFTILSLVFLGVLIGGGYFWWLKKTAANPASKNENVVIIPVNTETSSDNSAEEKNSDEAIQKPEIAPADMSVKGLNSGAAAGSAGKIKTLLVSNGYAKTEASNGQGENVVGSVVYYKSEQFKKTAEAIREILITDKTSFSVKEALTAEQQSADIVVILGK
ncbi:MAG: hypothetical protein A2Z52_00685 [Candidatus Moranbacteria bacterium RBG_19FT_COMBO_42_6]|nr:MAG: hypothetical protein A2Z52_00685 [Candidatus Moranbacteria bacterium RBG_19FT_COMBO_42_6]